MEKNELFSKSMIREVREETGLTIEMPSCAGYIIGIRVEYIM